MPIPNTVDENVALPFQLEGLITDLNRLFNQYAVTLNQIIGYLTSNVAPLAGLIGTLSKNAIVFSGPAPFNKTNAVEEVITTITTASVVGSINLVFGGAINNTTGATVRQIRRTNLAGVALRNTGTVAVGENGDVTTIDNGPAANQAYVLTGTGAIADNYTNIILGCINFGPTA